MLFGSGNPWAGRRWGQPQQQASPPVQPPQGFQQPQWAQPTPDMNYANQLAQHYGSQMPNQQVPGSAPMPQQQQPPQQAQPVAQTPVAQNPQQPPFMGLLSGLLGGNLRGRMADRRSAMMDWRQGQGPRPNLFNSGG